MTITYYPQGPISKESVEKIREEAKRHLEELNALCKELGYWKDDYLGFELVFNDYPEDVELNGMMLWTHHKVNKGSYLECLRSNDEPGDDVDFLVQQ